MTNLHVDGELNGLIKEYLEYFGLENASNAFVDDCEKLGIPINECNMKPKKELLQIQDELLHFFDEGNRTDFFALWSSHINHKTRTQYKISEKLEFLLQIHFAIFPFRRKNYLIKEDYEATMCYFRSYLETKGAFLSQSDELLPYYALPYVSNPKNHPTFKKLFEEAWMSSLKEQLKHYLEEQMTDMTEFSKRPSLLELYKQNNSILRDTQTELMSVQLKWKESEKINMIQTKNLVKLQEDCQKLMAISTDIISALESAVKGNLTDLDNVLTSCMQRFPGIFKYQKIEETEYNNNSQSNEENESSSIDLSNERCILNNAALDFVKIKNEFFTSEPEKIAVLLQALRWRLTKQLDKTLQLDALNEYIENDLLGSTKYTDYTKEFFEDVINSSAQLHQTFTRFLNAIASFQKGQKYLLDCPGILYFLQCAVMENKYNDSSSSNMALSALRKLSKHQEARNMLVEAGIVEWLIKVLLEEKFMSDYRLYSISTMLLNLCINTTAKLQCKQNSEELVNILNSNFLQEEEKSSNNQLQAPTLNSVVEVRQLMICLSEQEIMMDEPENDNGNHYEELEIIEPEIELDEPLNVEINGEELLKEYLNMHTTKEMDNSSESVEEKDEQKISVKNSCQFQLSRRSQSVPLTNSENINKLAQDQVSVSEPVTPKVDDEATEMVRKIIGETSKTLVTAETNSSPVRIKGLNSKEYALAFSSRPKIPRTPEAGEERSRSCTPLNRTYKLKKENRRQRVMLPKVASSSPPLSPSFEQHSPGLITHHSKLF